MNRMSSKERKAYVKIFQANLDNKKKGLEILKDCQKQDLQRGFFELVIPIMDGIIEYNAVITKLTRAIELLQNPAVETMDDDEFREYIKM